MPSEKRGGNYPKFPCGHKEAIGNLLMTNGITECRACAMLSERGKAKLRHQPSRSGVVAPRCYRAQLAYDGLLLAGSVTETRKYVTREELAKLYPNPGSVRGTK